MGYNLCPPPPSFPIWRQAQAWDTDRGSAKFWRGLGEGVRGNESPGPKGKQGSTPPLRGSALSLGAERRGVCYEPAQAWMGVKGTEYSRRQSTEPHPWGRTVDMLGQLKTQRRARCCDYRKATGPSSAHFLVLEMRAWTCPQACFGWSPCGVRVILHSPGELTASPAAGLGCRNLGDSRCCCSRRSVIGLCTQNVVSRPHGCHFRHASSL